MVSLSKRNVPIEDEGKNLDTKTLTMYLFEKALADSAALPSPSFALTAT